jgi:hypothetical protein
VEPEPDPASRLDLRLEDVAAVAGEDVVVVGARRAAGAGQPAQSGGRGGTDDVGVDAGPDGVQLGQPAEQVLLLGESSRRPLVEVVVRVDQPGGGQAPGRVDDPVVGADVGGAARPHRDDPVAVDDDVPVDVLGACRVDGRHGTALDDQAHVTPPRAARWTAAMMFS